MKSSRTALAFVGAILLSVGFAPSAAAYDYYTAGGSCPNGLGWSNASMPVPYYINQAAAVGLTVNDVKPAVRKSFDEWEGVACSNFSATYKGKTSQTISTSGSTHGSSKHVLDWFTQNWPQQFGNSVAYTMFSYSTSSCSMTHFDIAYNDVKYDWNTNGTITSSKSDVQTLTTHEVGHAAGLKHSSNSDATMYYLNDLNDRTLHQDDINGLCYLYQKPETCNGKDDDGDGQTDENLTQNCSKQQGVCQGATVACTNGSYPTCGSSEYGSDYESPETSCDGLDNDCDGQVDENLTQNCSKQQGVCQGSSVSCSGGSYPSCGSTQYGSDYESPETSCDGLDNDCDGQVDENLEQTYWRDNDGDGYGNPAVSKSSCPPAPGGYTDNDMDCAPRDPSEPGADGTCMTVADADTSSGTADTSFANPDVSPSPPDADTSDASDVPGPADTADAPPSSSDDGSDSATGGAGDSSPGADTTSGADDDSASNPGGCGCSRGAPGNPLHPLVWMLLIFGTAVVRRRPDAP